MMGYSFSKQDSNEEITKQINDLDSLISIIATKQESMHREINSQSDEIKKLVDGKEKVKHLLNTPRSSRGDQIDYMHKANVLQRSLDDLKRSYDELLREKNYVDSERKRFQSDKEQLEKEVRRWKEKDRERVTLQHQNGELEREVQRLKYRLEEAMRKKPVQIYIYAPSMNEKISTAVRSELQIILMGHLEATRGRQLEIVYTSDAKSVSSNKPLIVLCINASRLGTDVEQALQQVNCSKSVTVAVIHHKELHALPPQTSEKLLYGDKFRDLYAIVDIAFLTSKGMYTCDMNNRALERLTEFICQFDT
ncbi:centrosomal protein of 162 kDa-like [Saccostrea echinata]|uniref:centrosomal protein of 162 kDa-like n=1 Tax=Saccostrea echinata TaxID=191078 RepID=UPI002A7FDAE0|nr:centrosomal protein of 162 kDa-like [Saccostrea echinata]